MAVTKRYTIGAQWTLIASGRERGEIVEIQASAPIVIAVTVGRKSDPPDLPVGTGHRVSETDSIPITASQHVWASASSLAQVTVI